MSEHLKLLQTRWPCLAEQPPLVLVPVGSLEQHGPHLPLGTDAMIASAVTLEAARHLEARGVSVRVAPTISYGASGEHQDFPGTVSIGHDALWLMLVEYGRSVCRWADGVIWVNGHGGNVASLGSAVRQLRQEGRAAAWTSCSVAGGDAHAGHTETSLIQFLAPWAVRTDLREPGSTVPVERLMPQLRRSGVRAVSPNGVLGDPRTSSVEEGRRLFGELVLRVTAELADIDVDDNGRLTRPADDPEPARP